MKKNGLFWKMAFPLITALSLITFSSCGDDDDDGGAKSLTANSTALTYLAAGSVSQTVTINAVNISSWSSSSDDSWISISETETTITISVSDNNNVLSRTGYITVTAPDYDEGVRITVTQRGNQDLSPSLTASTTSLSFAAEASEAQTVTVRALNITNWNATPSSTWIKVVKGEGQITVSVDENESTTARTGTITISSTEITSTVTISVAQAAAAAQPTEKVTFTSGTTYSATSTARLYNASNFPESFSGYIETAYVDTDVYGDGGLYDLHLMTYFADKQDVNDVPLTLPIVTSSDGQFYLSSFSYNTFVYTNSNGAEENCQLYPCYIISTGEFFTDAELDELVEINWDSTTKTIDFTKTIDDHTAYVIYIIYSEVDGYVTATDGYAGLKVVVSDYSISASSASVMSYTNTINLNGQKLDSSKLGDSQRMANISKSVLR